MAGIYVHIPFCKQACHYCDFHFSTNRSNDESLIAAIERELALQHDYLAGELVDTIYFGGGTPSLLSAAQLAEVFNVVSKNFTVNPQAEITLEANPDDLSREKLDELKGLGINRLSIGIQTLSDSILTYLNRSHNSSDAIHSFNRARAAGFSNISVDLIYAIPSLEHALWQKSIDDILALQPEHISSYSLTIEEKTVFGNWQRKGKIKPVDESASATQLEMLIDALTSAGYEHYEVSNFSKPGYQSKHNSSYWRQVKYLGVGPSAHSFDGQSRQKNISNNHLYIRSIEKGLLPAEKEILSRADKINEFILTTLRTSWGCNYARLRDLYQYDLPAMQKDYIENLQQAGLAFQSAEHLCLTKKGRLLADKIASDLFLIEE